MVGTFGVATKNSPPDMKLEKDRTLDLFAWYSHALRDMSNRPVITPPITPLQFAFTDDEPSSSTRS